MDIVTHSQLSFSISRKQNIKDYLTFGNAFKWYQEMERNSRFEGAPTVMVGAQAVCTLAYFLSFL